MPVPARKKNESILIDQCNTSHHPPLPPPIVGEPCDLPDGITN
jgi:hypothetical protein